MAFYKYFWDLANTTNYSDHTVGSFDNNTASGGGDFKWVSNANNVPLANIPGVRIKPVNSTNGYWLRVSEGPVQVSWFGPQNTSSSPLTFAQLGVSQNTLNTRYGVSFVTTSDTYDTAAVKYAMEYMGTYAMENSLMFEPKKYWLTQTINLPVENTTITGLPALGGLGKFIIDGNGCTITTYGNGAPFDVFKRVPANQSEATLTYSNYSIVFKNFSATSVGSSWANSGYSFLFLGASPNVIIDNINLVNYDIGLRLESCPNASVSNVYTYNVKSYSVMVKTGSWTGAGLTNASSNITSISHLRVNDSGAQAAGLAIFGSSTCIVSQFSLLGTTVPQYGIYWDSLNNGDALNIRVIDANFVSATSQAGIYFKAGDRAQCIIDGIHNTAVQTIVSAEAYAGTPNVYISNVPNWPAGTKLSNTGGANWDFNSVYLGAGIDTPAEIVDPVNNLWVTAGPPAIPSVSNVAAQPIGGQPAVGLQQVLSYDRSTTNNYIFLGAQSGLSNTGANDVIGIGFDAARSNTGINVHAIGNTAALGNTGNGAIAIGNSAANNNTGNSVIALGAGAANGNTVSNVIALGQFAGASNAIPQSVIISNFCLPTYANYAAATAVITGIGATSGTYLYHDQATNSIGAVRIP